MEEEEKEEESGLHWTIGSVRLVELDVPREEVWDDRWGIVRMVYGYLHLPDGERIMITSLEAIDALARIFTSALRRAGEAD